MHHLLKHINQDITRTNLSICGGGGEGVFFSLNKILDKVSQCMHLKACVSLCQYGFYVVVVFLLRNKKIGNMDIPVCKKTFS